MQYTSVYVSKCDSKQYPVHDVQQLVHATVCDMQYTSAYDSECDSKQCTVPGVHRLAHETVRNTQYAEPLCSTRSAVNANTR